MCFEEISCSRWKSEGSVKSVGWPCSPHETCFAMWHQYWHLMMTDELLSSARPACTVSEVLRYSHCGDKAPCIQSFALVSSITVMAQVLGICKGRTMAELSLVHVLSAESPSKSTHALQMRSYSIHAWKLCPKTSICWVILDSIPHWICTLYLLCQSYSEWQGRLWLY